MTKEALKLALDALEEACELIGPAWHWQGEKGRPAITAIKQALAQDALDKMAENARELGLDYEPVSWKLGSSGIGGTGVTVEPEQEPVAYINVEQRKLEWAKYMTWDTPTVVNLPKIPLYTTPPQRIWVGLTDEEIAGFVNALWPVGAGAGKLLRAVEANLKDKNI